MKKFEIDYVKKIFVDNGCELLEKHYIDCEYAMSYKCHCGNISKISLSNFKKGKRCMLCAVNKRANARKHSYEYVSNFFRDNGCTLISKNYFRNDDFLDYICNCGNYSKITFNHFRSGSRCKQCGIHKRSGENHFKWNENREKMERTRKLKKKCYSLLRNCRLAFKAKKNNSSIESLKYTPEELDNYLKNHPDYEYTMKKIKDTNDKESVDHIFPISAFIDYNLDREEYMWLVNSLDNLKPMPLRENTKKGKKYDKYTFEKWLIEKNIDFFKNKNV